MKLLKDSIDLSWPDLISRSLNGEGITQDEALSILKVPDEEILEVLLAVFEVRKAHFGNKVKVCMLQNARSGICPEDCHYCSQSKISKAKIEKYGLLPKEKLLEAAKAAYESGARRYCMVTSGRGPSETDINHFCEVTREIKSKFPLEICISPGILSESQAKQLKESGVGWINHNLNTSEGYHSKICTTHTYQDRINTIKNVKRAGLMTCSGGIVGMGEEDEDIVELAFKAREIKMDSIPINFLHPIQGTPMENNHYLTPLKCLKVLCMVRFVNPTSEIRAAGGREVNLRSLQPLALYPANSIFVEGYLTTSGQKVKEAYQMIEEMGFEVERDAA